MTSMQDENGNDLIGYVQIDDVAIPRAQLAELLPDVARFERCLTVALTLSQHMTDNGGRAPAYVQSWSADYLDDVGATLREVADIQARLADGLRRYVHAH